MLYAVWPGVNLGLRWQSMRDECSTKIKTLYIRVVLISYQQANGCNCICVLCLTFCKSKIYLNNWNFFMGHHDVDKHVSVISTTFTIMFEFQINEKILKYWILESD